jgi:hypothetical protein
VEIADPNGFVFDGQRYLMFKNAFGHDAQRTSYLTITPVRPEGGGPGKWTDLLDLTGSDEDDVEGSALVLNPRPGEGGERRYVLFFTAGRFDNLNLKIEYATSQEVTGPYVRRGLLLGSGNVTLDGKKLFAPMGLDAVSRNVSEVVFEAWDSGGTSGPRRLHVAVLEYEGTGTRIAHVE